MSRYINADGKYFPTKYRMNTSSYAKGWNACIDSILQCSTEDVQEVKHGEWRECNDELSKYCSACGLVHGTLYSKAAFCPNCGAKMDEDEEEE